MKKKCIILCLIIFILFGGYNIYINRYKVIDNIFEIISERLENEMEKEVGSSFNLVFHNNGLFRIEHTSAGRQLEIHYNNNSEILMKNILRYRTAKNGRLYVVSNDGLAVITPDNNAIIYLYYVYKNDDNNSLTESKQIVHQNVKYISKFNEFNEDDIAYLLKYYHLPDDKIKD